MTKIGHQSLYSSVHDDHYFTPRRHAPARPSHGGPDAIPDPDDPARRPALYGGAVARAGADPDERVEPPDLSARPWTLRRTARVTADALRDRRPAPCCGAHGARRCDAGRRRARAMR